MARRGDALYLRGRTWWLDFRHHGVRHAIRLGTNISRTVAKELASVKRASILKRELIAQEMDLITDRDESIKAARSRVCAMATDLASPIEELKRVLGEEVQLTSRTLAVLRTTPIVYAWTSPSAILYIGMSARGIGRALRYDENKVDSVHIFVQPSREIALHEESKAIAIFRPCLNRTIKIGI